MSVAAPARENLAQPTPAEEGRLAELDRQLEEIVAAGLSTARLVSPNGEEIEIPESVFNALQFVAHGMAQGNTILLVPQGKELTTQQAADLLHVSRPHLVKLLEEKKIPFHLVGSHRRIRIEDVLAYRERRNEERRKALDELIDFAD